MQGVPVDVLEKFQFCLFPLADIFLLGPAQALDLIFEERLRFLFENLGKVLEIWFFLS